MTDKERADAQTPANDQQIQEKHSEDAKIKDLSPTEAQEEVRGGLDSFSFGASNAARNT